MIAQNLIRTAIDWGELAPLRLRARQVAEGVYAGVHRSACAGPGVEFGGYREYVPGDDLRWLDRRSLLRHDRLVVRQFETETDRALSPARRRVGVDGVPRAGERPAAKIAFAALLAAALGARRARQRRPGEPDVPRRAARTRARRPRSGGREQFERIVGGARGGRAGGRRAASTAPMLERAVAGAARGRRGAERSSSC